MHHEAPVLLIGGGETSSDQISRAKAHCERVVAADSGAEAALACDLMPDAVIGDFDSLSADARAAIPPDRLHAILEQDSTDFDKCLRNIEAPLVIGLGFTGARVDHELAAFNTLVRRPDRRCLLLGHDTLAFLTPPSLSLPLAAGTLVSLFPMGAVEGVSDGLRWPIAGLNFAPDGQIGTSNMATGEMSMSFTAPKMLTLLPASCFDLTVKALLETRASWPA